MNNKDSILEIGGQCSCDPTVQPVYFVVAAADLF
jgi:hypothetical protein